MESFVDYILLLLAQFGGGPGPKENNLVRFGLPAVLWAVLFVVAWIRQRSQKVPREKLLVWGFGLALARELVMFSHVSLQLIGLGGAPIIYIAEPLEHGLTMAAVIMVAGAFLRYILDDEKVARRYLQVGLFVTAIAFLVSWWWWAGLASADPGSRFNRTVSGLVFHLMIAAFAAVAIALLSKKRGWLRNVVSIALGFYVIAGFLRLGNFVTQWEYSYIFCPICNSLYIVSIPLLAYVYLQEQAIEKRQAEAALEAYRDQLEELVEERTSELHGTNERLRQEIAERQQAEAAIAQRNTELAAQNAIVATLSRSLDLDTILDTALDTVLSVLEMEVGCIFLLKADGSTLALHTYRGEKSPDPLAVESPDQPCSCASLAWRAMRNLQPMTLNVDDFAAECRSPFVTGEDLHTMASIPLVSKGRAVGALSLGTQRPNALTKASLELLTATGQQIGMAVENAHLYRETEDWANELTMLHQVSIFLGSTLDLDEIYDHIAEQSAKLVSCQVTGIFHWDSERKEAFGVASHGQNADWIEGQLLSLDRDPILYELVTQRRSVAIEEGRTDPRLPERWKSGLGIQSVLCVPVWSTEEPMAFLFLIDQQKQRHWRRIEIELVESFVNRAGAALENAFLHKQLEWAAALEERQRIAAEMHDGLAQTLSYIALRTGTASHFLQEGRIPEALTEHAVIEKALDQATAEVRRSIATLQQSPPPRRPVQEWVADVVYEHAQESGPPIRLDVRALGSLFLPPDHVEQIVRILKEALLNVSRHAEAEQAIVQFDRQGDEIVLTVEDNGQGFDPDALPEDGRDRFGLSIMRARAARIGAQIQIDSAPGQGTRLVLTCKPDGKPSNGTHTYHADLHSAPGTEAG